MADTYDEYRARGGTVSRDSYEREADNVATHGSADVLDD